MTLMQRRRALMGAQKKVKNGLVNGVYNSTLTVTNETTIDANPLPFNKYTTVPLIKPVHVNQSVAMMRNGLGSDSNRTVGWYALIDGQRARLNSGTDNFYPNTWYEANTSGELTAIVSLGIAGNGYYCTDTYSVKVDGEVIF